MTAFRSVCFVFTQARESRLSVVQILDCWASYLSSKINCHLTSLWVFLLCLMFSQSFVDCNQHRKSCHFSVKDTHHGGYHSCLSPDPVSGSELCKVSCKLNFGPCYISGGKINYGHWVKETFFFFEAAKLTWQHFYCFAFKWEQKRSCDSAGISSMYLKSAISYYFGQSRYHTASVIKTLIYPPNAYYSHSTGEELNCTET